MGAFARDLILEYYHKIEPTRKTTDLDLGIKVAVWEDFDKLIGYATFFL